MWETVRNTVIGICIILIGVTAFACTRKSAEQRYTERAEKRAKQIEEALMFKPYANEIDRTAKRIDERQARETELGDAKADAVSRFEDGLNRRLVNAAKQYSEKAKECILGEEPKPTPMPTAPAALSAPAEPSSSILEENRKLKRKLKKTEELEERLRTLESRETLESKIQSLNDEEQIHSCQVRFTNRSKDRVKVFQLMDDEETPLPFGENGERAFIELKPGVSRTVVLEKNPDGTNKKLFVYRVEVIEKGMWGRTLKNDPNTLKFPPHGLIVRNVTIRPSGQVEIN